MEFEREGFRYDRFYRGVVLDNDDPSKIGRVKVNILGMFDEINSDDVPWAVPAFSIGSGSGVGYGDLSVPSVGSMVYCFFEQGDIYQPVYFASAPDAVHGVPTEAKTNYPDRRVIKTPGGIVLYIDDSDLEIKALLPSGTYIKLDSSVNIVHSSGSYVTIDSSGNITISGTRVDINP